MKNRTDYEILYGRRPVFESMRGFRKVFEICGTDSGLDWLRKEIAKFSMKITVPIRRMDKESLCRLARHPDHQGLCAKVAFFGYAELLDMLGENSKLLVLIDEVTDPHNLGAIIRTACLCGASGVIIPSRKSAKITPVVVHASAGATEHIPIVSVSSTAHAAQILRDNGFAIISAQKPSIGTKSIWKFAPPEKVLVVFGSEGTGISKKILSKCDLAISIPQVGIVDSFNVSVSAGIILSYLAKEMGLLENE